MYAEIKKEMSLQVSFHAKRNPSFSFLLGLNYDVLIAEQNNKKKTWLIHYTLRWQKLRFDIDVKRMTGSEIYLFNMQISICLSVYKKKKKSRICLQALTSKF